jgi:hypothetical protein
MNGDAIVMMAIAMLVLWGGLVVALLNLRRSPDLPAQEDVHRDL